VWGLRISLLGDGIGGTAAHVSVVIHVQLLYDPTECDEHGSSRPKPGLKCVFSG
jgi:hypothetical protein